MWFADFDNTFKKDYVMHVLCPLWKRSASVAYTIVFHSVGLLIEVFRFHNFLVISFQFTNESANRISFFRSMKSKTMPLFA